jgi:hypothetical protein
MENPIILHSLNDYINKKTATRLKVVSKLFYYYIKPKNYRENFLKLDTSDLAKIKMFADYGIESFYIFMLSLKTFKYISTRFNCWNNTHWSYIVTYLVYRYLIFEYSEEYIENEQPFMYNYYGYINTDLIYRTHYTKYICIYELYEKINKYNHYRYRELILY